MLRMTRRPLARFMALDRLELIYKEIALRENPARFPDKILDVLRITHDVRERDLSRIPRRGPVLVVANHPFGGIDGIILCSLLLAVRGDVKVMANHLLSLIPEFRDIFIAVNPFGTREAVRNNFGPLRETMACLRRGGMVGIFPAGEVSHLRWQCPRISDPPWNSQIAAIVRRTGASVLPVYFNGANSLFFQLSGLLHPRLRTVMLPREMLKKTDSAVHVKIGTPLPFKRLEKFSRDAEMIRYLRLRTYMLAHQSPKRPSGPRCAQKGAEVSPQPIISPLRPGLLAREVLDLPPKQLLAVHHDFQVFEAATPQIPRLLQEIGRLREITFRKVGEGTGRPVDLDRFDACYRHVFLWHKKQREVVGAYRLGLTDHILKTSGKKGLYTHTLFKYGAPFLNLINPAVELGRSFVRSEYQRSFHPLMLLWKGIARFVARNPHYKNLFGPVSITRDYRTLSRSLMVAYLNKNNHRIDLAGLIKPRRPFKNQSLKGRDLKTTLALLEDIQELSEMVSELETDQKGVPVLLRHYVKLGGKFLGFSVDPHFGDVLDGLILVDLTRTDPKILERLMGKEPAAEFLAFHRSPIMAKCA